MSSHKRNSPDRSRSRSPISRTKSEKYYQPKDDFSLASTIPPSAVVHFQYLPDDVNNEDVITLAERFGPVQNCLLLKLKGQALLEMNDVSVAKMMVSKYTTSPPMIRGKKISVQFSIHTELTKQGSSSAFDSSHPERDRNPNFDGDDLAPPSRVLRVIIGNIKHGDKVKLEAVHHIFSKHGEIDKMLVFRKGVVYWALVQFKSTTEAVAAKLALNGLSMYTDSCKLRIIFSTHHHDLEIKKESDRARDFTKNPRSHSNRCGQGSRRAETSSKSSGGKSCHYDRERGRNHRGSDRELHRGSDRSDRGSDCRPVQRSDCRSDRRSDQGSDCRSDQRSDTRGGSDLVHRSYNENSARSDNIDQRPLLSHIPSKRCNSDLYDRASRSPCRDVKRRNSIPHVASQTETIFTPEVHRRSDQVLDQSRESDQRSDRGLDRMLGGRLDERPDWVHWSYGNMNAAVSDNFDQRPLHPQLYSSRSRSPCRAVKRGTCVLHVANLAENIVTPEILFTLFGVYGQVLRVNVIFGRTDIALIQMGDEDQAELAKQNLYDTVLYGKKMRVSYSKYYTAELPKEQDSFGLTTDFTDSKLNRHFKPGPRKLQNSCPPSQTLFLSHFGLTNSKDYILKLFADVGFDVEAFKFVNKDRRTALVRMSSVEEAIKTLVMMHNYEIEPEHHLQVSFTKSIIQPD